MGILKKVLMVVALIIAVPLIAGLFMASDYHVERNVTIDKSKSEVFEYVKYLKNQDNFSKWALMDPAMQKTHSGTDGTVGFVSGWISDHPDVGIGEQEITGIMEGKRINYELRFKEPFEDTATAYITTDAVADSVTKVVWAFEGTFPYPMNVMLPFMGMEEMIGADFQEGLNNLKNILEKS